MKRRQFVGLYRFSKFGIGEIQIRKVARKGLTLRKKNKNIRRVIANGRFFTRHPAKTGAERVKEVSEKNILAKMNQPGLKSKSADGEKMGKAIPTKSGSTVEK